MDARIGASAWCRAQVTRRASQCAAELLLRSALPVQTGLDLQRRKRRTRLRDARSPAGRPKTRSRMPVYKGLQTGGSRSAPRNRPHPAHRLAQRMRDAARRARKRHKPATRCKWARLPASSQPPGAAPVRRRREPDSPQPAMRRPHNATDNRPTGRPSSIVFHTRRCPSPTPTPDPRPLRHPSARSSAEEPALQGAAAGFGVSPRVRSGANPDGEGREPSETGTAVSPFRD